MTPLPPLWLVAAVLLLGVAWGGKHGTIAKRATFAVLVVFFIVNTVINPEQRYPSLVFALVGAGFLIRESRSVAGHA